jgi:hypothetical protein
MLTDSLFFVVEAFKMAAMIDGCWLQISASFAN